MINHKQEILEFAEKCQEIFKEQESLFNQIKDQMAEAVASPDDIKTEEELERRLAIVKDFIKAIFDNGEKLYDIAQFCSLFMSQFKAHNEFLEKIDSKMNQLLTLGKLNSPEREGQA